ncbi:class II aldolase/adducin family protein [Streptomyces sp. NPDC057877]|uniref:class II aldolase/adducin family protein n=1 Tax=Streptomyces sp. NPDC057877 TaxID=3346269 RepID=UPI003698626E
MTTTPSSVTALLQEMGRAGARLDTLRACEAGAGNVSVALPTPADLAVTFPRFEACELPGAAPALAGWTVLVTGSGQRLRDVGAAPTAAVAAVSIDADGSATLRYADDRAWARPTSEFNSHLAVHDDQVGRRGLTGPHSVVHAQPPYLVALSHHGPADSAKFSRQILRWEPETVVQLPEGVGFLDFMVPGSQRLQEASVAGLREARIVIWAKHGLLARSDDGPLKAVDLIEYAETGAMYEALNTRTGSLGQGLTDDEVRAVIEAFDVRTTLF